MHTRVQIRQTLIDLVENETGNSFPDMNDGTVLREELGLDSIDVVSIISQIERQFRLRLSHQELETLITVGDLLDLLISKVDEPPMSAAA